jgi:hypothetical protein
MRIFVLLIVCASLFLASCQKEVGYANGNNGSSGNNEPLLKKIVSTSGSDSSTLVFGYNSARKLMTLDIIDASGGSTAVTNERVERNPQGIIQKLIIKSDQYQQYGVDSIETIVGYASGRYVSKVTSFDLGAFIVKDSVSLVYDGNGKVTMERTFDDLGTGSYDESSKVDYTYSGNNIATINYYNFDASSSSYTLAETFTYDEYDNKISPMSIGNEAFVFESPELYSFNNPTKSSVTATRSSAQTYSVTYTYSSSNRPLLATSTVQPGNYIVTGTYYYQ